MSGDDMRILRISVIAALLLLIACSKDSASLLQTVELLESKADYAAAIAELMAGLRAEPQNGVLRYHLGRMYNLQFDGPSAENELRKASQSGVVEGGRIVLALGRALFQQRKYREITTEIVASSAYERSILSSVHALRGHALMSLERIDDAKKELEAAAALDPGNADAVLLRAQFKAEGRDGEGARQLVEKLLSQQPKNVDAWIHQADLLIISGKPRESLVSFGKALEIHPRHLHALIKRAIVLVQLGRLNDAQKDVDTLRKVYPKHPVSAYLRGQIHYWRGEYREALDMAQVALKADQEGPARLLSGMSSLMLDAPSQAEHELALYLARHPRNATVRRMLMDLRREMNQKGGGLKALASIHADELRKASVQALYGDAFISAWQYSKVADWMERIAVSAPPDPMIAVRHAQRRFSREQLDLAASDLERIVALSADIKPADTALVLVQLARRDLARAIDAVSEIEKKTPNSPQAATLAGIVLIERNQLEEAERRFDEALQRDPKLIAAVIGRARLDVATRKAELARSRFEDALRADPENLQVLIMWALLEETASKRNEAHKLLDRALRAHPKALEPKVVLIGLLKKINEKSRALAAVEEMLAAHPQDPMAIDVAADIQLWNGDRDRGLATLKHLVTVLPKSPESYFKLARAQFAAGLKVEANANLQKALELPIEGTDTQGLPLWGLIDDSKTLEAIETARKSYKPRTRLAEGESWSKQFGGSTFYDTLSGTEAGAR